VPFAGEAAPRGAAHRWLDWALMAFGLACLLWYGVATLQTSLYQRHAKAQLARTIAASTAAPQSALPESAVPASPARESSAPESPTMLRSRPVAGARPAPLARGSLIGRVDVQRLHLSAAIAEGDDESTLSRAVGHLPDTPLPWQRSGNAAFAAHRDGLFRPLRDIRVDDEIKVVTARGEFLYRVKNTKVVDPSDVSVLAPTKAATITLITCYPFSFVGHAPQRFIVQAERVVPELSGTPLKGSAPRS
jgi:sortase A